MASITKGNQTIFLEDNSLIRDVCEKLDILFSCRSGYCGTCQIKVVEGQQNLDELTEEESEMGMDRTSRLACQCRIKSGNIVITQP